ncbi:MAG: hypothetical protein RL169_231 [Armatimonadota bacterium]
MILISLIAILTWSLSAIGVGRLLVPSWTWRPFERNAIAWTVGTGILPLGVLFLGLAGLARPMAIWGVICAAGVLSWLIGLTKEKPTLLLKLPKLSLQGCLVIATCLLVTVSAGIAAAAPPGTLEWDTLSYHFAVPKTWLRAGRIFFVPYDHHSNFPFTMQLGYMAMLSAGSEAAAKWLHTLSGLALAVSVYATTRRLLPDSKFAPLVAVGTLLSTPMVFWEMTVAYVDIATTLFTWMSLSILLVLVKTEGETSPTQTERLRMLILSGVLMGCALGTKMTVLLFWGMILVGMLAYGVIIRKTQIPTAIGHASLWGSLGLIVGSPWYIKTFLYTGNPVYPYFYQIFGGKYWTAEHAARYTADQAAFGLGKKPVDALLAPWNLVNEALLIGQKPWIFTEYVQFGLAPTLVIALVGLFWVTPKLSREAIAILLFGLGIGASWFVLMQQTRYLLPGLPCAAVLTAVVFVSSSKPVRACLSAILGICFLWTLSVGMPLLNDGLNTVTSRQSREDQIFRRLGPLGRASIWINQNTPIDAKVALFDEVRGYYIDRQVLWAEPNHADGLLPWTSFADSADLARELKKRGYTVILINQANRGADKGSVSGGWRGLVEGAVNTGQFTPLASFGREGQETVVYGINIQ